MALLWMDGFDMGDTVQRGYATVGNITRWTTTRFGSGAMVSTEYDQGLKKSFTASAQVFVGVAMTGRTLVTYPGVGTLSTMSLCGDNGVTRHLTLSLYKDRLVLTLGAYNGTVLGTYVRAATNSVFDYYEMSATIASTGGTCTVRLNGNVVISFTGNTKNGGTNTTVDAVSFGNNYAGGEYTYVDDLYICDGTGSAPYNTFLGDVRVLSLSPTADGSSKQWTPDTGTTNYSRVNEVPYSAANYVTSGTVGQRDTYAMADLTGSPTVLALQTCVVAKKSDAGTMNLKPAIKSGASVYYGATTALAGSDTTLTDLRTVDPATAAAWTVTGVNAIEAGMEVA